MAIQARARTRMHTVLPSLARPACQSASGLQINRQLAKRACMRWQPHESENSRSCRTSRQGDGILPYRMTDTVCLSRKSLLTPDRFAATGGFLANRSELLVKRLDFGLRIEKMGVKQESLRFLHENWWTTTARHAYHGDVPNEGAKWKPRLIPDRNSPTEIPRPGHLTRATIMPDIFAEPTVRAALAVTILLVVILIAFWLMGRLRDYTTQDNQTASEGLGNLKEMLRKGDISEAEFRTIQSTTRSQRVSSPPTQTQPVRSPETSSDSSDEGSEI